MALDRNERVEAFLDQVCSQVKAKEMHGEIRLEIGGHLEEAIAARRGEGVSEEEAVRLAIESMGDPKRIGKHLHSVHKPKTEWSVLLLTALLVGIGIVTMLGIQLSAVDQRISGMAFAVRKAMFSVIGFGLLLLLYFADYRKLKGWIRPLYGAASVLLLLPQAWLWGPTVVNGSKAWISLGPFTLHAPTLALYLFAAAIAGRVSLEERKPRRSLREQAFFFAKDFIVYYAIPGIFYLSCGSATTFAVHFICVTVLLLAGKRWKRAAAYGALVVAIPAIAAFGMPSLFALSGKLALYYDRLRTYFGYYSDPKLADFYSNRSLDAISSAGWWGQGFGTTLKNMPYTYSENVLTYFIYSLGWAAGIAFAAILLLYGARIFGMARQTADPFASSLVIGLFSVIAGKFALSLLMTFELLPPHSSAPPFIAYGGLNQVLELAAVGLMLSVYRRKDMVPRDAASGRAK